MKKTAFVLAVLLALTLCFGLTCSAAKDRTPSNREFYSMERQTPTVDGAIGEGEYALSFVMDGATKCVYYGKYKGNVTYYLAWDDDALYVAAQVKDVTLAPCTDGNAYGHDCVSVWLNPNGLIPYYRAGYEIYMSPTEDGGVAFSRYNYGLGEFYHGETMTQYVSGVSVIDNKNYTLEARLEWGFITEVPEFADFEPAKAASLIQLAYSEKTQRSVADGGDYLTGSARYGKDYTNAQSVATEYYTVEMTFDKPAEETAELPFVTVYCIIAGVLAVGAVCVVLFVKKKVQ